MRMSSISNECGGCRSILLRRDLCTNRSLATKENFIKALIEFLFSDTSVIEMKRIKSTLFSIYSQNILCLIW